MIFQKTKRLKNGAYKMASETILGKGVFNTEICLGKIVQTEQLVAIKKINKPWMIERIPDMVKNLINEINALAKCLQYENPFIIKQMDFFESHDNLYIVTEYCQEKQVIEYDKDSMITLSQKLNRKKEEHIKLGQSWNFEINLFDENVVLSIGFQIALALLSLANSKIVHGDVTLENILLSRDTIRLSGFGQARIAPKFPYAPEFTSAIAKKNKGPEYQNGPRTPKLDIWALGCILYELLFGRHFLCDTKEENYLQKIHDEVHIPKKNFISPSTENQLKSLLKVNYIARPDALEVICHPAFDFCRQKYTSLLHPKMHLQCQQQFQIRTIKALPNLKEHIRILKQGVYSHSYNALGEGRFGTVYPGKIEATGVKIAVKAIPMKKIRKFGIEGEIHIAYEKLMSALLQKNPYVITFVDYHSTDTNYYIITELCQDGNLQQFMAEKHHQSYIKVSEALEIMFQLFLGCSSLHQKNIVHRDIRPGNIFRSGDIFKIGDFGCSKIVPDKFSTNLFVGTLCNIAPELFDDQKVKNQKIDVWSLACVFHELLFGFNFWQRNDTYQIQQAIMNTPFTCKEISKGGEAIESDIRNLLTQMFSKDMFDRPDIRFILKNEIFDFCRGRYAGVMDTELQYKFFE